MKKENLIHRRFESYDLIDLYIITYFSGLSCFVTLGLVILISEL